MVVMPNFVGGIVTLTNLPENSGFGSRRSPGLPALDGSARPLI